ncbi:MAG TPA: SagB family peptide dehydrogenase [Pseudonocardiaceae bacterium]
MRLQPADRVPARRRLLSLSEDALVETGPGGDHLVVVSQWGEIRVDETSAPVRESLQRMSLGPVSVENLPIVGESFLRWKTGSRDECCEPWYRLRRVLEQLGSCVVQSLGVDDEAGPVLSVAPVSPRAGFWLPQAIAPDQPIRLSTFAAVRSGGGQLLMESPVAKYEVVLHRPVAAWVTGSLGGPTTAADLAAQLGIPGPVLADILAYLVASGMVLTGEPDAPARFAEDGNPALIPWSHHDLALHARSRMGRQGGQAGAVFPYVDQLPAAPVSKPRPSGPRFPLHRPELAKVAAADPPLTEAIEDRRCYRDCAADPVTAEQLGELLFRVARIRWTKLVASAVGPRYMISDRPYPSTSDLYELELYVTLDRCAGLPRGSYHYDPGEHALTLVDDSEPTISEILDAAKVAAGSTNRPAVLITMTSRIARVSWMYSGIAYSATLRHVGMLQQTLYLVATAMGLASCALTVGDATTADEALRLDWPTEVSVGEFIIGVRP